ncbi:MAG: RdgB/HAM1 family non-canonical purine NTP pyrophosphatase [Thiohalomonadales bacterium]
MASQRRVLASANQGKLREMQSILQPLDWDIVTQAELNIESVPETGLTFVENALIKARHAAEQSGLPALSDDSGLAVDALKGQPGIFSARYAGEQANDSDNITKLLQALQGYDHADRGAQFHCVIVYMRTADDPTPLICHASWQGRILTAAQGVNGFGYDPIFYVPEFNCSAAELDAKDKNRLSHRGQALRQLVKALIPQ